MRITTKQSNRSGSTLASERPNYGSLELVRFPDGPAPRFGSCYFVLCGVSGRTSITFIGSEDPRATDRAGTLASPHGVMAALLAEIEQGGMASLVGFRLVAGMDGVLDAAVIGRAAASLHREFEQWQEWGSYLKVLQLFRTLACAGALRHG